MSNSRGERQLLHLLTLCLFFRASLAFCIFFSLTTLGHGEVPSWKLSCDGLKSAHVGFGPVKYLRGISIREQRQNRKTKETEFLLSDKQGCWLKLLGSELTQINLEDVADHSITPVRMKNRLISGSEIPFQRLRSEAVAFCKSYPDITRANKVPSKRFFCQYEQMDNKLASGQILQINPFSYQDLGSEYQVLIFEDSIIGIGIKRFKRLELVDSRITYFR